MNVTFLARLVDGRKFAAQITGYTTYRDAERLIKQHLLENNLPALRVLFIGLPNMKV